MFFLAEFIVVSTLIVMTVIPSIILFALALDAFFDIF
jgi:hypothetical protein